MKVFNNKLKNELNIRTEKNYPIEGVEFIDIMPLIIDKNSLKEIIDLFTNEISASLDLYSNSYPYIVTCLADPFAWLMSLIPLFIGYFLYIYRPYMHYKKEISGLVNRKTA